MLVFFMKIPIFLLLIGVGLIIFLIVGLAVTRTRLLISRKRLRSAMHNSVELSNFLALFTQNMKSEADMQNWMNVTARYVMELVEGITLKNYIATDKLFMPVAPALLLKGMIDTDKEMKQQGCTYQDFVTEQFYQTGIFDMIQSKQKTTDDIQDALLKHSYQHGDEGGFIMMAKTNDGFKPYTPKNEKDANGKKYSYNLENGKGYNYCTVDQCFKPAVIAYFRDGKVTGDVPEAKLKALEKALANNALTAGDFKPSEGFTFFHSVGDEVVPYCNYESVRNTWGSNHIKGVTYQSNTTFHVATGAAFFTTYCGSLAGEIFNDKWQPCEQTKGNGLW